MQGRVLGNRYRLLSPLGVGGMGSVWRAEQLNLPLKLAIKLINPAQVGSSEIRERFKREAHAAARLRSMHIVHISDYGIDEDTPFLVMELLEGESLAERLKRRRVLPFDETLRILAQIAKALTFAHENAIIHRDLKPENVFIEGYRQENDEYQAESELVKVLDFGVAKILDAPSASSDLQTRTGVFLGTPFYMSPEQIRDSSTVDHRTDIWSFAVIAYECVTGQRPFQATNLADLQFAICRDPLVLPSQRAPVPDGFDAWFEQAAARDLSSRFQTVKAAMASLRGIRDAALGLSSPPTTSKPPIGDVPIGDVPIGEVSLSPVANDTARDRVAGPASDAINALALTPNTMGPSSATAPGLLNRSAPRLALGAASLIVVAGLLATWYTHTMPEAVRASPSGWSSLGSRVPIDGLTNAPITEIRGAPPTVAPVPSYVTSPAAIAPSGSVSQALAGRRPAGGTPAAVLRKPPSSLAGATASGSVPAAPKPTSPTPSKYGFE